METIVKLENVSKQFDNKTIIEKLNLEVKKGEIIGIVGENGIGKSVLFKIIAGIYKPTSGNVYVFGHKLGNKYDFPPSTGILIDSPRFIDVYTAFQNLKYLAAIQNKIDDAIIRDYMNILELNPNDKTKYKNLSLGTKQKLAITQAIMENQELILLDEPFNALDEKSHKKMIALFLQLSEQGKTILITSHNSKDINDLCDKVYKIDQGNLMKL